MADIAGGSGVESELEIGDERRLIPIVGHNLPQEAPREFAEAILTLVRGSSETGPTRS